MSVRSVRRVAVAVVVLALVAGVVAAVVAVVLRRAQGDDAAAPEPTPSATALDRADLSSLPIARDSFCDALARDTVEQALGGPVAGSSAYDSGQEAELAPGVRDVSHEYSCTYRGADGTQARAWVFAEPVRRSVAEEIVRDARSAPACRELGDLATLGRPSVGMSCRLQRPPRTEVTLSGLFGDAWLSCQLGAPGDDPRVRQQLPDRAEQWCVDVATTLATRA